MDWKEWAQKHFSGIRDSMSDEEMQEHIIDILDSWGVEEETYPEVESAQNESPDKMSVKAIADIAGDMWNVCGPKGRVACIPTLIVSLTKMSPMEVLDFYQATSGVVKPSSTGHVVDAFLAMITEGNSVVKHWTRHHEDEWNHFQKEGEIYSFVVWRSMSAVGWLRNDGEGTPTFLTEAGEAARAKFKQ